jgi:diguanylate cyclase (GGDEF)-like protein
MKILLVDDAKSVQLLMGARLSSYGYEVVHASNGQQALELFASAAPDLVLMDVEMPVMNGFEATNRIRAFEATQQWAWTPIIFLTSSDTVENLITAIEAGGDDFMSKNVVEPVLHAKMKAMSRIAGLRRSLSMANHRLQELAHRDGLTGLFNRRSMDVRTDTFWHDAVQGGLPFGLLMLDIDHFKNFNDHYGHQAGDDCLCQVARCMEATVQAFSARGRVQGAFVARYGGEEFAVVLPQASLRESQELAGEVVQAVRTLALPHDKNAHWAVVTVSVGGVHTARAHGPVNVLFRQADAQLYLAKQSGRNQALVVSAAPLPDLPRLRPDAPARQEMA